MKTFWANNKEYIVDDDALLAYEIIHIRNQLKRWMALGIVSEV